MAADDVAEDPTEREEREAAGQVLLVEHACLHLVLHAERPLMGGARFSLDGVDEVLIGRGAGETLGLERSARARLTLRLPSRLLSSSHARLWRDGDRWQLEDAGSTNGVYLNGVKVARQALGPGDVFELGRIFFVLRTTTRPIHEPVADVVSSDGADVLGFETLSSRVELRLRELKRVAASEVCVALSGETGSGKEVMARAIHSISKRPGPFVAINCGALTQTLMESQLFGHVRGAFSGAVSDAAGFIRSAHTGTLLLDEAGDLQRPAQAALLRVLQEREVVPVGSSRPHPIDVRFVTASAQPLEHSVGDGTFRPDLFARLSGFSHRLTALRERREDIGMLIASLLRRFGVADSDKPRILPDVALRLLSYTWPLNVRELEQWLRLGWVLADAGLITTMPEIAPTAEDADDSAATQSQRVLSTVDVELRRELIEQLERTAGNVAEVARAMQKAPVQVYRWMKRYSLDPEAFRERRPKP